MQSFVYNVHCMFLCLYVRVFVCLYTIAKFYGHQGTKWNGIACIVQPSWKSDRKQTKIGPNNDAECMQISKSNFENPIEFKLGRCVYECVWVYVSAIKEKCLITLIGIYAQLILIDFSGSQLFECVCVCGNRNIIGWDLIFNVHALTAFLSPSFSSTFIAIDEFITFFSIWNSTSAPNNHRKINFASFVSR